MDILLKIACYILLFYIYVSVFVILFERNLNSRSIFRIKFLNGNFFSIGWFLGIFFFLKGGFDVSLFFIPEDWKIFDGNDLITIKEGLSISLTFLAMWWLEEKKYLFSSKIFYNKK